ncbi:DSBA-like thioredoxin domain-containing protein [Sarocladium implicatum]|nr:DSBA-like thioredoxin domain-containing protein [Sarocladium implicatum]
MPRPSITLYLDTVSPFSYIVYYILRTSPVFANCDVTYVPAFLGGVMTMCGNTAPLHIKNKAEYTNLSRRRWATAFSVPMHSDMPQGFPHLTLPIMRPLALLHAKDGGAVPGKQSRLTALLDAIFPAYFVDHRAPHELADRLAILGAVLPGGEEEAKKVEEAGKTQEAKDRLKEYTQEAFDKGAFGMPWMVCKDREGREEGFFGVDSLGQVTTFLGLERPDEKGWKALL